MINLFKKNSARFPENNPRSFKNPIFVILTCLLLLVIIFAYSNHFSNSFHFDDSHTIVDNSAIQNINIVRFFTDGTTASSLPQNQGYRPLTTLQNAVDYKIAGGLHTEAFHTHIFLSFLMLCFLIGVLIKKLLDKIQFSEYNHYWALLVVAIFGLLCANAETVNYVIQRAEITAALFVVAGLVAFINGGFWRSKLIYLLFPLIGLFAKEMAFVFAPLLLLYLLIFEEEVYLLHFYKKEEFKKCLKSFYKTLPAIILSISYYFFYVSQQTTAFSPGGSSSYNYLITQPMVAVHYIVTYFIPYNLSIDTDWAVYTSIFDYRAITGIVIVLLLLFVALKASKNKNTRLFSFGILWFFISLIPTSMIPFAEVLNDHRTFIPYIGLTIAFVFGVHYLLQKYFANSFTKTAFQNTILIGIVLLLAGNVYGVRKRNKVWNTEISVWKDATIKSPKNGRGWMNYGLALMENGDYINAEKCFNKSLTLVPNYSYAYINMGIIKKAMGNQIEAEINLKKAIDLDPSNYVAYYFYGKFLSDNGRNEEAKVNLKKSLSISPSYSSAQFTLMALYHNERNWDLLKSLAEEILAASPENAEAKNYLSYAIQKKTIEMVMEENAKNSPTAEKYLNLSLNYFRTNQFNESITAAKKALTHKTDYPEAYNNIGISHFMLGNYDQAIEAYNSALAINPEYKLAKNNLANAVQAQNAEAGYSTNSDENLTSDDYLNLSLTHYNQGNYKACIEAARRSNELAPSSAAFNNICTAYNQLKEYDKAIEACNQALKIDATNQYAKGNLNYAKSQKKLK
jgi:tetratricopeptide (TPR) repeat protein